MNKIEELIKQLCPDGVVWKKIGEVFNVQNGYTPSKNQASFWDGGTIPWFRLEDIRENGRFLDDSIQHITLDAIKKGGLFKARSIIISTTATIGEYALIDCDFMCNQQITCLTPLSNNIDIHFFYHYAAIIGEWCKKNVNGSGLALVPTSKLKDLEIPLPPLRIQEEIVSILDKFVEQQEQLEKLIELRKKQYEYYREELLTPKEGEVWEKKTIADICEIKCGKDYKHLGEGNIPVYGSGGIMTYVDTFAYDKPTVLLPRKGSISNVFYVEGPFWNVDTIFYTDIYNNVAIPKFFYYLITKEHIEQYNTSNAARPALTRECLQKIQLMVPSINKQLHIVEALQTFESSIEGLSKSLEASKTRYAHYRDQLLNFN